MKNVLTLVFGINRKLPQSLHDDVSGLLLHNMDPVEVLGLTVSSLKGIVSNYEAKLRLFQLE